MSIQLVYAGNSAFTWSGIIGRIADQFGIGYISSPLGVEGIPSTPRGEVAQTI